MRPDLQAALERLRLSRPIFSSESDLQHALAWQLQQIEPQLQIRLERRPVPEVREAADLWLTTSEGTLVVAELKYLVRKADVTVAGERFVLANQGAHDISRYDVVKDVGRVERWVRQGLAARGLVLVLSNDPAYWKPPTRSTIDRDFRIHEGRDLHGDLAWATHAGAGTTRSRTNPVRLTGRYELRWLDYARLPNGQQSRYLLIDTATSRAPVVPPPGS
ncbi:hypothetical protein [Nitriliruptor alkaliphilus]|uniref:hypothetical protein n=1 Tax=Nitriliruptor alkaliphilus TaxID=427918 RepID=UPI0012EE8BB4|nr:hypothetical protein [Nitriliruptor alkaliphilus]